MCIRDRVTGDTNHKVDIELFLANCSREERDASVSYTHLTIQTLIKNGHTDEALSFTQKLTESIAVFLSLIGLRQLLITRSVRLSLIHILSIQTKKDRKENSGQPAYPCGSGAIRKGSL